MESLEIIVYKENVTILGKVISILYQMFRGAWREQSGAAGLEPCRPTEPIPEQWGAWLICLKLVHASKRNPNCE